MSHRKHHRIENSIYFPALLVALSGSIIYDVNFQAEEKIIRLSMGFRFMPNRKILPVYDLFKKK